MLWSAGEAGGAGHWKMCKLVVGGIEECMDENCNYGGGNVLQGTVKLNICRHGGQAGWRLSLDVRVRDLGA